MDEAKRRLVQGWLVKAQHDLVKGFLVLHDQRVVRTHDVRFLVTQAMAFSEGFSELLLEHAERLTPYATAYRYPDETLEPDREEFAQALVAAEEIYRFVLTVVPEAAHPDQTAPPVQEEPISED